MYPYLVKLLFSFVIRHYTVLPTESEYGKNSCYKPHWSGRKGSREKIATWIHLWISDAMQIIITDTSSFTEDFNHYTD